MFGEVGAPKRFFWGLEPSGYRLKLNVHKTFRRRPVRAVSRGKLHEY